MATDQATANPTSIAEKRWRRIPAGPVRNTCLHLKEKPISFGAEKLLDNWLAILSNSSTICWRPRPGEVDHNSHPYVWLGDLWSNVDLHLSESMAGCEAQISRCQMQTLQLPGSPAANLVLYVLEQQRQMFATWSQWRNTPLADTSYTQWRRFVSGSVTMHNQTADFLNLARKFNVEFPYQFQDQPKQLASRVLGLGLAGGHLARNQALQLVNLICDFDEFQRQVETVEPEHRALWGMVQDILKSQGAQWPLDGTRMLFPRRLMPSGPAKGGVEQSEALRIASTEDIWRLADDYEGLAARLKQIPFLVEDVPADGGSSYSDLKNAYCTAMANLRVGALLLRLMYYKAGGLSFSDEVEVEVGGVSVFNASDPSEFSDDLPDHESESIDLDAFFESIRAHESSADQATEEIDVEELLGAIENCSLSANAPSNAQNESSSQGTDQNNSASATSVAEVSQNKARDDQRWVNNSNFCPVCYRRTGSRKFCKLHLNTGGKGRVEIHRAQRGLTAYHEALLRLREVQNTASVSNRPLHAPSDYRQPTYCSTVAELQEATQTSLVELEGVALFGITSEPQTEAALAELKDALSVIRTRVENTAVSGTNVWAEVAWAIAGLRDLARLVQKMASLVDQVVPKDASTVDPSKLLSYEMRVFTAAYTVDHLFRIREACSNAKAIGLVPIDFMRDFFTHWFGGYTPRYSIGHAFNAGARDDTYVESHTGLRSAFEINNLWDHCARLAAWRLVNQDAPQRKSRVRRLETAELLKMRSDGLSTMQIAQAMGATEAGVKAAMARIDKASLQKPSAPG